MRLSVIVLAFVSLAIGQDAAPEMKHVIVPVPKGNREVHLAALNIERGVEYPTVFKLSGNVEIKTPVCLPTGKKGAWCATATWWFMPKKHNSTRTRDKSRRAEM